MTLATPKLDIYLLKSIDETANSEDKYVDYLLESKLMMINETKLVNVLEFKFINLADFQKNLNRFFNNKNNEEISYSCLIVTSRQVVEAMKLIDLKIEIDETMGKMEFLIYCVGEQTRIQLKSFLLSKFPMFEKYFDIRIPSVRQNANELANLIVMENRGPCRAFYPCSSIRKDDLIMKLKEARLEVDELKLYETIASKTATNYLLKCLNEKNRFFTFPLINCFVLFSPSCVQSAFECDELREKLTNDSNYFITIGPSTSSKLKAFHHNFVEMNEPSPKCLVDTLGIVYSKIIN